jgi:hypothetical protein
MASRSNRKVLFLLAACIIFSVCFAELAVAGDHDHICTGEGCPYCLSIETVDHFLKSLKLGGFALLLTVCPMFFDQAFKKHAAFVFCLDSPISLKVRFNS